MALSLHHSLSTWPGVSSIILEPVASTGVGLIDFSFFLPFWVLAAVDSVLFSGGASFTTAEFLLDTASVHFRSISADNYNHDSFPEIGFSIWVLDSVA